MTRPHLIGLAGFARVGKDSIGNVLAEHGYNRLAFADKLRELAWAIDPTWKQLIEDRGYEDVKSDPHYGPLLRTYLVNLGAGARKVLGYDVWLDALLPVSTSSAHNLGVLATPTVVTDVRYANEALRITQLGGVVWYIVRPGIGPANEEEERSFSLLPPPDCVILNDGSLDALKKTVQDALNSYA